MKQRILAVLVLCVVLFAGQALTVSASSSDAWENIPSDEWSGLEDPWASSSEYGFANDMIIFATVFDGLEAKVESAADIDKLKVFATELEPGHPYLVSLDFLCAIDREKLDKYDDVNLQVRFPAALLKNSPNAIGYSINGSQLETWCDTFGVESAQNLNLYYIDKTARIITPVVDGKTQIEDVDDLFASADGLALGPIFRQAMANPMEIDGHDIVYFQLEFAIYADANTTGVSSSDLVLNYWAGQKLMSDFRTTPAPESYYRTAILDSKGIIHVAKSAVGKKRVDTPAIAIGVTLLLAVVGVGIYLGQKVRQAAHERGIKGFKNILLDLLQPPDEP